MKVSAADRLFKNFVMGLLLIAALVMIATAVSGDSRERLSSWPGLVADTLKRSLVGAI